MNMIGKRTSKNQMIRNHITAIAAVVAILVSAYSLRALAEETATGAIAVQIVGVKGISGKVCVAVYNDADSYPDAGKHYRFVCGDIKDGKSLLVFKNVPPGAYAAFAFHDADENGKLKKNFIGMPREGVGASRGARGVMGPPKFRDAKFQVGAERKAIQIRLKYL